jgi:hypothetical protein
MRAVGLVALVVVFLGLATWALRASNEAKTFERRLAESEREAGAPRKLGTATAGCSERGGVISRGAFGENYCKVTFADAGHACTDMSDCLGGCTASGGGVVDATRPQKGTCKSANLQFGCTSYLIQGHIYAVECID